MTISIKQFKNLRFISNSSLLWLCTFILPLAVGLIFIKIYKLLTINPVDIGIISTRIFTLTRSESLFIGIFILIVIGVKTYAFYHRHLYKNYYGSLINYLLMASFITGLSLLKLAHLSGMNIFKFIGTFKQDYLFILVFTYFSVMLLEFPKGKIQRIMRVLLTTTATLLISLIMLDFVFYMVAGAQGDWFIFKYSIMNLSEVGALGSDELNMVHLLLLISPFSLPILSLSASRLSFVNRWLNGVQTTPASRKLQIISWSIVLIILIGSSQFFSSKSKFAGNVIGELGRGGWSDFFVQSEDYTGIRDDDKDIFDSSRMELITTDRTKLYNIVIILLESFHADAITPYNLSLQTTPFLNKLSKNSMLVNKMYALNNYTTDGIITVHCGNYPPDRKSTQYPIFYKGLPDLLEPLGYGSSYFTGQKLNYEHNRKLVKNIGFKDIHGQNDLPKEGYSKINWTGYEERITLKPSLKWIDQSIEKDQPFIITYLTTTSHQPYTVPEAFSKIQYTHPSNKLLNDYYNAIRYVDAFLENLFSEFEKRGLFDSSIFILVGDHGDNVGKGLRKLTEPSFHVPCLILGPSIKGVNHIGGMRQQIDILPTIIDYLGLDITNGKIPGTSLLEDVSKDRYIFFRNWNPNDPLLVRTGDLKYIFPKDGSAARVHNIEEDPDEQRNISNQFTPEHLGAIKEKYLHWHIRVNYNYDRHLKGYQP